MSKRYVAGVPVRKRASGGTIAWRFLTGQHLDGKVRSDADFWRRGTTGLGEPRWFGISDASWWAMLPGWRRAAYRLGGVATLVSLAAEPHPTEWVLTLGGGPLTGYAACRAYQRAATAAHRNGTVRPLAAALAVPLEMPPAELERTMTVPRVIEPGTEIVIPLSASHQGMPGQHEAARRITGQRLGHEWDSRLKRAPLRLVLARRPDLPTMVPIADVRAELDARPTAKILLGRETDGSIQWWDRASEDPMMAVHGGSRRGKTSLLLSLAAQELARGGAVTVIDPKRTGFVRLSGCPGFALFNDRRNIHGMWEAVAGFRRMIEDRYEALVADPTIEFPYSLLIIDEMTLFAEVTAAAWRKEKGKSDPALAPVWDDLAECVWTGAQCRAHVVVAGQRLDYRILGGMIGSFGTRLMAGFQPQDYVRLIGVPPVQRSQKPRGRFLIYQAGGDPTWTQLTFGEADEWRDYALEHVRGGAVEVATQASDLGAMALEPATCDVAPLAGLAEGAAYLGLSVAAFRKRRERGEGVPGEFRIGNQPAWFPADLDRWAGRVPA